MKRILLIIISLLIPLTYSLAQTYVGTWICISSVDVVEGETINNYMKGKSLTVKDDGTYTSTSDAMGNGMFIIQGNQFAVQNTDGNIFMGTISLNGNQLVMEGTSSYGVEFRYVFEKAEQENHVGLWICVSSVDGVNKENYMKGQSLTVNADGTFVSTSEKMGQGVYTIQGDVVTAKNVSGTTLSATVTFNKDRMTLYGFTSYGVEFYYMFWRYRNIDSGDVVDPNETEFNLDGVTYERTRGNEFSLVDIQTYVTDLVVPESIKRGSNTYVVTSIGNNACTNSYVGTLTLNDYITVIGEMAFYGNDFETLTINKNVKTIKRAAFAKNQFLTSLTIGENVEYIGESAFHSCPVLTTIVIESGKAVIYNYAFHNCPSIKDVHCYGESIPKAYSDAFVDTPIENATLHVPASLVTAYQVVGPWNKFKEIVAIEEKPNAIMGAKQSNNSNGEYYDLMGRKSLQLKKGIYIKNGKKVIVK